MALIKEMYKVGRIGALVTPKWLDKNFHKEPDETKLILLDSQFSWSKNGGLEAYNKKHIGMSRLFNLNQCIQPRPTCPRPLPDPTCLERQLRQLGVSMEDRLVVYDSGPMGHAAYTRWLLMSYGHQGDIYVLDGGLSGWSKAGYATESKSTSKAQTEQAEKQISYQGDSLNPHHIHYSVEMNPEQIAHFEDIQAQIGNNTHQIVDCRLPKNFQGLELEPSKASELAMNVLDTPLPSSMLRGHIKGSVNMPASMVIDKETGNLLPKTKLIEVFQQHGVDLARPATYLCYNGFTASLVSFAATQCSNQKTQLYYGSWTEFGQLASPEHVHCEHPEPIPEPVPEPA